MTNAFKRVFSEVPKLDKVAPKGCRGKVRGWLDFNSGDTCALGKIFGSYGTGRDTLNEGGYYITPRDNGFWINPGNDFRRAVDVLCLVLAWNLASFTWPPAPKKAAA